MTTTMTDKQWKARMAKVKDWEGAKKAADQQGGSLPDGRYRAKFNSAELSESQSSGREQINCFLEVTEEGDYQGQTFGIFPGLDEEKSLPWTIAALRRLGYKIEEPEDIVDVVKSLNDDLPEVMVRVKNGFTNLDGLFQAKGEDQIGDEDEAPIEEEEEVVEEEQVEEESSEEEAHVEVGSTVEFDWKGETLTGTIKEILEEEGKLKVSANGKVYPVKAENATLVTPEEAPEDEEEVVEDEPEEDPEPKQKVKRKETKPVAKKVTKPAAKKASKKK